MERILAPFIGEFIALVAAVCLFQRMSAFLKIIALQVMVCCAVELTGYLLIQYKIPNAGLYNAYLLVDFCCLLYASYVYLRYKGIFFIGVLVLFLLFFLHSLYLSGVQVFSTSSYIFASAVHIIVYLLILYHSTIRNDRAVLLQPVFWICLGIIMFYGCNLPYFSLREYVQAHFSLHEKLFFAQIINILVGIRYLFVAVGFFLYFKQSPKTITPVISE